MKQLFPLIIILSLLSCHAPVTESPTGLATKPFDTAYLPAVFKDDNRMAAISKWMPVVDSLFKRTAIANHFPGIAYGIVVDGEMIHTGNYGYTDIDKKIPVSSSSVFRIASMSKSFTAMAILKLRDEGKLRLDDPAENYIPAMKKLKYATVDAPKITVRHLLTHGAGFPEDNPWGDRQLADSDQELIALIEKQVSFSNPPDLEFEYSNLGFALLGKIVTEVSGKPYQQYIKENIWQPIGMKTAEWEYANVPADKLAHGYRWLNEKWNEETLLHDKADGSWGAMGGMLSSIDDFGKYMALHLSAWPPTNAPEVGPIKRSSIREMHFPWRVTGQNTNYRYADGRICPIMSAYAYGLGWVKDCDGKVYVSHSGGLPGFGSQWRIMPDYGIGVVAFANRTYAGVGGVNMQVLDTLVKLAALKPRSLPASRILEQRKNELVKILPDWNNAEKSGIFAENFFPDYPIDTLKKYARDLYSKAGKIISVEPVNAENQLRGSFLMKGEKTNIEIYFTLSPENPALIQEYHIQESKKN